jgi:ABC-2 type transport system permease protein
VVGHGRELKGLATHEATTATKSSQRSLLPIEDNLRASFVRFVASCVGRVVPRLRACLMTRHRARPPSAELAGGAPPGGARGLLHLAGLYVAYLRVYARTLAEYRADTCLALLTGLLSQASGFLLLTVLVRRLPSLAGWSFYELVFFYAFATTVAALGTTFLDAPFRVSSYVWSGGLDVLLHRPVGPLFQIIGLSQQPNSISAACAGLALIGYAAAHLGLAWGTGRAAYLPVALVSAMVIRFAVLMLVASLNFWSRMQPLVYPVSWLFDFLRYPLDLFSPPVRGLLTFVVPYAMASYYPAAFLLRPERFWWAAWAVPATAVGLAVAVRVAWSAALRRYESTGGLGLGPGGAY